MWTKTAMIEILNEKVEKFVVKFCWFLETWESKWMVVIALSIGLVSRNWGVVEVV